MKLTWTIEASDREAVAMLVADTKKHRVVRDRHALNVNGQGPSFSRDEIWRVMIGCLLTTQQKSGPDAPIGRVLHATPFPLALDRCKPGRVEKYVATALTKAGGIRRAPTIAAEVARNLDALNNGGWATIETEFTKLLRQRNQSPDPAHGIAERTAAEVIDQLLWGFGPKQSRNFWQWLGLTRYEIPLDSRIIAWLNNTLGLSISAAGLSSDTYYNFVGDGIRELCAQCGVLPCVFDAAVFSAQEPVKILDLSTRRARARARARQSMRTVSK